jgi:hypothetical protein
LRERPRLGRRRDRGDDTGQDQRALGELRDGVGVVAEEGTVAPTLRQRSASSSAISRQTAFAAPIAWSRALLIAARRISVRFSALSLAGTSRALQTISASCSTVITLGMA